MHAEPQKEHQWLQKMVGEWTSEMEATMEPGKPPAQFVGKESVRSLGGLWVLCEGQCGMPGGGTGTTMMTLGYDPHKKRFVGSFVGSMMAFQWLYDGALDAGGNRLVLDSEGPSFSGDGSMAKYQDVIEFKSEDHRILSSHTPGPDGKVVCFMTAHYRRVK